MLKKYTIPLKLLRLISRTWRIKFIGELPSTPCVIAFWHGEMLPVWQYFSNKQIKENQKFNAIVSLSNDGDILSKLLNMMQYTLIRGSSSNNNVGVLKKMLEVGGKENILITPDGPRGPRQKMKAGAFIVSQRTQIPLILLRCKIKNKKIFKKSWDKFELPLPFTNVDIFVINSFIVPSNLSYNELNKFILDNESKMKNF